MKKEEILKRTNNGLNFYHFVIPNLKVIGNKCKNTYNPFYDDRHPGLSIYFNEDQWYYHDFGEPENYSGDVFSFAGHYYDLNPKTQFPEILKRIWDDLGLDDDSPPSQLLRASPVFDPAIPMYTLYKRDLEERDRQYFNQFGIPEEVLRRYNVYPLKGYEAVSRNGVKFKDSGEHKLLYAFEGSGFAKVYCPDPKKFVVLGELPEGYIFGAEQAEELLKQNHQSPYLVVTGGEKDVLTLVSMGVENVVCFMNESPRVPKQFFKRFGSLIKSDQVIVLYDFDDHGFSTSSKLTRIYGFIEMHLPMVADKFNIKDVSEFVAAGGSFLLKEEFNEMDGFDFDLPIEKDEIALTNLLPDSLFETLPVSIKSFVNRYNPRERDLLYLGLLTISGVLFSNVSIQYGHTREYPHLYTMILAPQGSGKGVMKVAKQILRKPMEILEEKIMGGYLTIPANSSSAALLSNLYRNKGVGVIIDTEADTLTTTFKNDWGNYSSILRQAFHSEEVGSSRKKNNELIIIPEPKLSLLLTGTLNQLRSLIKDKENGLLTRFVFYIFNGEPEWVNQFVIDSAKEKAKDQLSDKFVKLITKLHKNDRSYEVVLPSELQESFNEYFTELKLELVEVLPEVGDGIANRLGTIAMKALMTHTIWGFIDKKSIPCKPKIKVKDFDAVLELITHLKNHAVEAFQLMSKVDRTYKSNNMSEYLRQLPYEFTRKEADELAKSMKIKKSTSEYYIRAYIKNEELERVEHGRYRKIS